MATVVIKKEVPDTYFLKMPTRGVDCGGGVNMNEEKTKPAPKVTNDGDRKNNDGIKDNGPLTKSNAKIQRNGLHKNLENAFGHKRPPVTATTTQPLDSSRCGEIFVTKNARKWTFVCTFCQKSTRDIGEFVCHIKFKHMNCSYSDDDDETGTCINSNQYFPQRENLTDSSGLDDSSFNQGQDYIDCTNYLDVNVTEDSADLPPFKTEVPSLFKPIALVKQEKTQASIKREASNKRGGNDVVDLSDEEDDDDEDDNNDDTDKNTLDPEPMYFDYDYDGQEDEDGGVQIIDDIENETERMEDSSSQLLRSSSTEGGDSNTYIGYDFDNDTKRYRSHVKGTAYCELCDKTFQYYSLYRNHMIKHSNVTPFKCQFCSKGFKSKQAIRYHMNTHAKEKPYSCPVCATTYATSSLFMSHVMSHESENCFPCMVCTKIFKTQREREVHLESHSQERPYRCTFCSKRFRQKHHLSNHLKLHCQYRCDFCKESFNSTQAQRRPYACQTCEEKPGIRHQVERQRSITASKSQDGPPLMKFENVMIQSSTTAASPEAAIDVASDEESEESNGFLLSEARKNILKCKFCQTTYTHAGALNFHIRQKHPEHFT